MRSIARTALPLVVLGTIWTVTLGVWGLAWADVPEGILGEVQESLRTYCFGWNPDDPGSSIGRSAAMALLPLILSGAVVVVWKRELFSTRAGLWGMAGIALCGLGAAATLTILSPARPPAPIAITLGPAEREECLPFTLTDEEGRRFELVETRGRVVCLTFFYTRCFHTCPGQIGKMRAVEKALRDRVGRDLLFVAVSIDPVRDDSAALREYAVRLGVQRDGWRMLHGERSEVERLLKRFGVAFGIPAEIRDTTQIGHTAVVVLLDRAGRRAREFYGTDYPDETLVDAARELLAEADPRR